MGKMLHVDLGSRAYQSHPLDPELVRLFFGGRGLGIGLLYTHSSRLEQFGAYQNAFAEIDPLLPEDPLIFSTSPPTGTKMPTAGRFHLNFKSPLTGGVGSTNSGGYWGVAFKKTGHDVLYITGKSEKPVYLVISGERVEFKETQEFQTSNTEDTTDTLSQRLPKGSRVIAIGQAEKWGTLCINHERKGTRSRPRRRSRMRCEESVRHRGDSDFLPWKLSKNSD